MAKALMRSEILLHSGRYFNLEDPHRSEFDEYDIAHALAHICRFAGHTSSFYSVAQHSVMVSHLVPTEHALAGLMHDAPEAFIGDVSSPLKAMLPAYKVIERRVEQAVFSRFDLALPLPESVKHADLVMLATEQRDFMPPHDDEWPIIAGIEPLAGTLQPWPTQYAYDRFVWRFVELITMRSAK